MNSEKQPDSPRLPAVVRGTRLVCFTAGALLLIVAAVLRAGWMRDNAILRAQALAVVQGSRNSAEAVVALNHWVYEHEGFAKNHRYFIVKALGPTPLQVLQSGGDCSDKSRLLSAMLNEIGIPSGLVMVYPCPNCDPIHTVVEAKYGDGRMVVDPIWNVDYPAENGRYYGVRDLAGNQRGPARILQLKQQTAQGTKIWRMPDTEATFTYAAGINWKKNSITKAAASTLRQLRIEPATVFRPRILEDPKLALLILVIATSAAAFAMGGLLLPIEAYMRRAG